MTNFHEVNETHNGKNVRGIVSDTISVLATTGAGGLNVIFKGDGGSFGLTNLHEESFRAIIDFEMKIEEMRTKFAVEEIALIGTAIFLETQKHPEQVEVLVGYGLSRISLVSNDNNGVMLKVISGLGMMVGNAPELQAFSGKIGIPIPKTGNLDHAAFRQAVEKFLASRYPVKDGSKMTFDGVSEMEAEINNR